MTDIRAFWTVYWRTFFSKELWCSWFMLLLIAVSLWGVLTSDQSGIQLIKSSAALVIIGLVTTLIGCAAGYYAHRRKEGLQP